MREVTLYISDHKYQLFIEMVKSLDFVKKIKESDEQPTKEQILSGISDAVDEVKLIKAGKLQPKTLKNLLNEL